MKTCILALAMLLLPSTIEAQTRTFRQGVRMRPHATVGALVGSHFRRRPVAFVQPFSFAPFSFYSPSFYSPVAPPGYWPYPTYSAPIYSAPTYPYVAPEAVAPSTTNQINDLTYQLQRLTEEVERLRAERELVQMQTEQPPAPEARPAEPERPLIPTALIFRDGRRIEAGGYAIVGETLWILSESSSTRVALTDLDLDSTRRENAARGIRFLQ